MEKIYRAVLRLYETKAAVKPPCRPGFVMYDNETYPFVFTLLTRADGCGGDDVPFAVPDGAGVEMSVETAKKSGLTIVGQTLDAANGVVRVDVNAEHMPDVGTYAAQISLVLGRQRLTWSDFDFDVRRSLKPVTRIVGAQLLDADSFGLADITGALLYI
jgi:hypothetical protein